jgi:prolyl-tRNA synthetase
LEKQAVFCCRRDTFAKASVNFEHLPNKISELLENIQANLYAQALEKQNKNTRVISNRINYDEINELLNTQPGFLQLAWGGDKQDEDTLQDATKATIRCILDESIAEDVVCAITGKKAFANVLLARAY